MLEFADGLGLDLADALAGDFEDAADLFERVGVAVADAVTQLDDLALAVGERLEDDVDAVLEHFLRGRGDGRIDLIVLDEIAEVAVLALADGHGFLTFDIGHSIFVIRYSLAPDPLISRAGRPAELLDRAKT